jgi:hypothetical protein
MFQSYIMELYSEHMPESQSSRQTTPCQRQSTSAALPPASWRRTREGAYHSRKKPPVKVDHPQEGLELLHSGRLRKLLDGCHMRVQLQHTCR